MKNKARYPRLMMSGGDIGSLLGGAASLAVPGLGAVLSPVLGAIGGHVDKSFAKTREMKDTYDTIKVNNNPYGYAAGGALPGMSTEMVTYDGPDHNQGGINTTAGGVPTDQPDAPVNVEGGETKLNLGAGYIFSKRLKIR